MEERKLKLFKLAAQNEQGQTFSRFILPKKGISFHSSRVNKFQTTVIGGKKVLHRGGNILETVSQAECLEAFVDFIAASKTRNDSAKVILIGHNSSSFDTPVLLRTLQQYSPQHIPKMKELSQHSSRRQSCFDSKTHSRKMPSVANRGRFVCEDKPSSCLQSPF